VKEEEIMSEQTFSDVKILDLSWHISGPYCTKIFADYGADVIKVEIPGSGDPARMMEPFLDDEPHPEKSLLFSHLNTNKRGITLDLKSETGIKTIKELVNDSHVLVENFSPGVMDRLGLDYDTLKQINPNLVMTSISNYGQTGPYRDYKLSELVLNGFHSMINSGELERYPVKKGGNACLYQGGLVAALATLGAFWAAEEQGFGQHLDISLMETQAGDIDRKTVDMVAWTYSGGTIYCPRPKPEEWAAAHIMPGGVFPCKDGFIASLPILPHWTRFLELMNNSDLEAVEYPDEVLDAEADIKGVIDVMWYDWLSERTKKEVMEECQAVKWFGTTINTPQDAVEDPQFTGRGFWVEAEHPVSGKQTYPGAPIKIGDDSWKLRKPAPMLGEHNEEIIGGQIHRVQSRSTITSNTSAESEKSVIKKLPLEGIRVVDLTVVFAGPFATWLLACLGAEVIRIDSIHHWPDMGRVFTMWPTEELLKGRDMKAYPGGKVGERPWNQSAFFTRVGWNKKCCTINLTDPKGKEIFKNLIKTSDVFIENNSANALDHLDLGPDVLMKANPNLVCINMPSYGRTGPYRNYVGWGDNAEALTGHNWVRGYNDEAHPVHNTPVFHMDSTGGTTAALGAIMGLRRRKKTGKGVAIDFGQIESFMPQLGEIYMDYAWNGRVQRTLGNRHPQAVQGCYRCRGEDAWINITLNNAEEWDGLCTAMGNPSWTKEERFATHTSRRENHDQLDKHLEAWTQIYDKIELFHVLQSRAVPAGPVHYEADTYHDPHLLTRDFFNVIYQEDTGTYRYPGFLWKMSETPGKVQSPPPPMGEHNDYVFRELLQMSPEEIEQLTEAKIIGGDRYEWA